LKGELIGEETVSGESNGRRRKTTGSQGPHVSEGEGEIGYRFGKGFLGRGLDLELGQIVSPGAFYIFILFSSLFFSVFLFLLYLLQNSFKSIQTTFRNFLKINTMFKTIRKYVFKINADFQ
jgi:hypothetical protein